MSLPVLKKGAHIHLMGICGTAMASLAGLLKHMGYKVTGSDENVYPPMSTQLEKLKIPVALGYSAENLAPRPHLVIVGNVITKKNPEAQALLASEIPYTSLPQALGEFVIGERESLVVAGTHGKTTTTSLLAWIAQNAQPGTGFLVGGIPKNFDKSFQMPERQYFVIEGDEYDTAFFDKVPKFVHYKPRHVILTSIEFDHADIYQDLDSVKAAFERLLTLIPRQGTLVAYVDDANIQSIIAKCPAQKILTYGLNEGDVQARNVITTPEGIEFDLFKHGARVEKIKTKLYGDYNIKNITASYALASELGWSAEKVRKAIASFEGVKRRQEILGEPGGVTVIEDFAHHPTAVQATLEAVHERYPDKHVFAIFEPRSATSRRAVFQQDYAQALRGPHTVLLPPAFNQEALDPSDRLSVENLIESLRSHETEAHLLSDVDGIVGHVKKHAKPGDLVLIMSNGGFGGIYQKLLNALQ